MQSGFLIKHLILPLSILTILFFALAYFISWQGLFISLSTTFLGILITVFYVDVILREHDKQRWSGVTNHVYKEVEKLAHGSISLLCIAIFPGQSLFNISTGGSDHDLAMYNEIRHVIIDVLIPSLPTRLPQLDSATLDHIIHGLGELHTMATKSIEGFSAVMEPELLASFLKINERITLLRVYYTFLYGIAGNGWEPREDIKMDVLPRMNKEMEDTLLSYADLLERLFRETHPNAGKGG